MAAEAETQAETVLRVVEPVPRPVPAQPEVEPVAIDADASIAHRRIFALMDAGSFVEIGGQIRHRATGFGIEGKRPPGDGVVTGFGLVDGHRVFVASQDKSALGGSLGEAHAKKIMRIQDMALESRAALVTIKDSGGARVQEGICALDGYANIFRRQVRASGQIPQISVVCGPCAGGAAYGPALADMIVMSSDGNMFLTGPRIVKAVCDEDVTTEALGGSGVHAQQTGLAHLVRGSDSEAIASARQLLQLIQQPRIDTVDEGGAEDPSRHLPQSDRDVYDVRPLIADLVDHGSFIELQERYCPNIVIGFARIGGQAVGIVANNPRKLGGVLTGAAAAKAARFVRLCDTYELPLITLIDVPGFMPGTNQEHSNVIGHGSKLLYAYAESNVTKISVVMRKAFGGAYIAMSSKGLGSHLAYAWPDAQIAVMGDLGAMEILHRREIAAAGPERAELEAELRQAYRESMMAPQRAAERGHIDGIIEPAETRSVILRALSVVRGQARTHGLNQM